MAPLLSPRNGAPSKNVAPPRFGASHGASSVPAPYLPLNFHRSWRLLSPRAMFALEFPSIMAPPRFGAPHGASSVSRAMFALEFPSIMAPASSLTWRPLRGRPSQGILLDIPEIPNIPEIPKNPYFQKSKRGCGMHPQYIRFYPMCFYPKYGSTI